MSKAPRFFLGPMGRCGNCGQPKEQHNRQGKLLLCSEQTIAKVERVGMVIPKPMHVQYRPAPTDE